METLRTLSKQAPISSSGKHAPTVALLFLSGPQVEGFLGDPVAKNVPANAGGAGSSPAPGKIAHVEGAAGPGTITTDPALELTGCNKRGRHSGRPVHYNWKRAPTRHS